MVVVELLLLCDDEVVLVGVLVFMRSAAQTSASMSQVIVALSSRRTSLLPLSLRALVLIRHLIRAWSRGEESGSKS
jgi:hypothetical protein